MIAFALLCLFSGLTVALVWCTIYEAEENSKVPETFGVLGVLLSLGVVFSAVAAVVTLSDETEPRYFPVIINVPTLVEHR